MLTKSSDGKANASSELTEINVIFFEIYIGQDYFLQYKLLVCFSFVIVNFMQYISSTIDRQFSWKLSTAPCSTLLT